MLCAVQTQDTRSLPLGTEQLNLKSKTTDQNRQIKTEQQLRHPDRLAWQLLTVVSFSPKRIVLRSNEVLEGQCVMTSLLMFMEKAFLWERCEGWEVWRSLNWDYTSRFSASVWHNSVEHLNWLFVGLICPNDREKREEREWRKATSSV